MFSDGSSTGPRERVALCVRVASDTGVSRPTVGLMVDLDLTLAEVLMQALTFPDAFQKDDVEVQRILSSRMDITLSNAKTQNTEDEVRVTASTTVRDAMCFGAFDRVWFRPIEEAPTVTLPNFLGLHASLSFVSCRPSW